MIILFILTIIALQILWWSIIYKTKDNAMQWLLTSFINILVILIWIVYSNSPKAMDVYQGKTTLEISYRDSIPVDSTVVFKE